MDFTLRSSGHAPSSASYLPHRGERLSFLHEQVGSPTSPVEAKSCREVHAKGCIGQVHNRLIPDFDVGCKVWKKTTLRSSSKYHTNERLRLQRRIFDCGYLDSLHKEKLLLTDEQILGVLPDGLLTTNDFVPAHVIVLATGFQTNMFVPYTRIQGQHGTSLDEHWSRHDGPGAYNCSIMSGFPNFFLLLGPNAATGHTSAIMTSEKYVVCHQDKKKERKLTPQALSTTHFVS